jgi:hypothetical protein
MKHALFLIFILHGAQAILRNVLAGKSTAIKMKAPRRSDNETNYLRIRYKHQQDYEVIYEYRVQGKRLPTIFRTDSQGLRFAQRLSVEFNKHTTLHIDTVEAADDNTYIVEANGRIYNLRLVVSTRFLGPHITSVPQSQVQGTVFISEGHKLQMFCQVEGAIDYSVNILWRFQNIHDQHVDFKNNSIVLRNISPKVSGNMYICHARSFFGQVGYSHMQIVVVTRKDFIDRNQEFKDLLETGGFLLLGYFIAVIVIILLVIVALCLCNITTPPPQAQEF